MQEHHRTYSTTVRARSIFTIGHILHTHAQTKLYPCRNRHLEKQAAVEQCAFLLVFWTVFLLASPLTVEVALCCWRQKRLG
jgi:hypothetical protein